MTSIYYLLINSLKNILRNKTIAMGNACFGFSYFLMTSLLMGITGNLIQLVDIGNKHLIGEEEPLYYFVVSEPKLLQLLLLACLSATVILLIFGGVYSYLALRRNLYVVKAELIIKKLLGSTSLMVSSEFYLEHILVNGSFSIVGWLVANKIYSCFYCSLDVLTQEKLYSPTFFSFYIGGSLFLLGILSFIRHFLALKRQVHRL